MPIKWFCFFMLLSSFQLDAQFRLPKFEVQTKVGWAGANFRDSNNRSYGYGTLIGGGDLSIPMNQHFSIGVFLSQSMPGAHLAVGGNVGTPNSWANYDVKHRAFGTMLRISANRLKRFRPYVDARVGKFEMYIDHDAYRLANSTFFLGGTLGLMTRLGSRMYVVFPEIVMMSRTQSFFFDTRKVPIVELRGGLCFNFDKRK
jgi:hypothetical protein